MVGIAFIVFVENASGINFLLEFRVILFPDFITVITIVNQRVQQSRTLERFVINREFVMIFIQQTGTQTGIRYQYAIHRMNHSVVYRIILQLIDNGRTMVDDT